MRKGNKIQYNLLLVYDVLWMVWKNYWLISNIVSWLCCYEMWIVIGIAISSLFVWTSHSNWFRDMVAKNIFEFKKNLKLNRILPF